MKITKIVLLMATLLASSSVFAYSPEEQNKQCHKPKFTDFTLKEYNANENNEVPAEAEFSFKLQAFTNPESIKMTVKNQPLPFTIESNSSFHKVSAKIPAEYSGKFLRIDARAKVTDGECYETTGWLLKVANKAGAAPAEAAATPAPTDAPKTEAAPAPAAEAPKAEAAPAAEAPKPAPAEAPKAEAAPATEAPKPAPAEAPKTEAAPAAEAPNPAPAEAPKAEAAPATEAPKPAPAETPKPVSAAPSESAKPMSIVATIAPATEPVELICVEKPKSK